MTAVWVIGSWLVAPFLAVAVLVAVSKLTKPKPQPGDRFTVLLAFYDPIAYDAARDLTDDRIHEFIEAGI